MGFKMTYDTRNRTNLDNLAVNTKVAALKWYQYCIDNQIDILIYETIRTEAQQKAYVASGASQTMKSYHLKGQALDFVPVEGKSTLWNGYDDAKIKNAIKEAKSLGFEWGGDWKSFVDKPHLQYNYKGYGTDPFTGSASTTTANTSNASSTTSTQKDSIVSGIQSTLNKRYNTGLVVDGIPGAKTLKALIMGYQTELNKQFKAGLVVDGIWGAKTKAATKTVSNGASGNLTYILQARLYILGYNPGAIDSKFGAKTEAAVKAFQKAKKLTVDGQAGKNTFAALLA